MSTKNRSKSRSNKNRGKSSSGESSSPPPKAKAKKIRKESSSSSSPKHKSSKNNKKSSSSSNKKKKLTKKKENVSSKNSKKKPTKNKQSASSNKKKKPTKKKESNSSSSSHELKGNKKKKATKKKESSSLSPELKGNKKKKPTKKKESNSSSSAPKPKDNKKKEESTSHPPPKKIPNKEKVVKKEESVPTPKKKSKSSEKEESVAKKKGKSSEKKESVPTPKKSVILEEKDSLVRLPNKATVEHLLAVPTTTKKLSIYDNKMTAKDLDNLSKFTQLEHLHLFINNHTFSKYREQGEITFLSHLNKLIYLRIEFLSHGGNLNIVAPHLQELHLLCPTLYPEDIQSIFNLSELRVLTLIEARTNSGGSFISHRDIKHITKLIKLEVLDLSETQYITVEALNIIAKLPSLTDLNLTQCYGVKELGDLVKSKTLTKLNLYQCQHMPDEGIKDIGQLTQLTSLTIGSSWEFKGLYMDYIVELTNLTSLSITKMRLTQEQVEKIAILSNLTEVILSDCEITTIRPLLGLTKLTKLDISYNKIEGRGLTGLQGLDTLTKLTSLNISGNNDLPYIVLGYIPKSVSVLDIGTIGSSKQSFEALVSLDHIDKLSLDSLTNEKLDAISSLTSLRTLILRSESNAFDDIGLAFLTNLVHLENFNLRQSKGITDIGLAKLSVLPITTLNLFSCKWLTEKTFTEVLPTFSSLRTLILYSVIPDNLKKVIAAYEIKHPVVHVDFSKSVFS